MHFTNLDDTHVYVHGYHVHDMNLEYSEKLCRNKSLTRNVHRDPIDKLKPKISSWELKQNEQIRTIIVMSKTSMTICENSASFFFNRRSKHLSSFKCVIYCLEYEEDDVMCTFPPLKSIKVSITNHVYDFQKRNEQIRTSTVMSKTLITICEHSASFFLNQISKHLGSFRCVICRLEYEEDDVMSTLPCKHLYHSDCMQQWL
ncbi:hypothetical protein MPTK1_5g19100 [Marchantia polymorpha subsp. ruderalis]|uniref:RING-type domain-containing protein n=2 Tax=Marchantia polymorpha TaxID=3197 RepID=A0AAF6BJY4_MARPO|nr:hypothetical protein MARPO_0073s0033 [Marchantia polymorpha]BBN12318.1 hypothetical protein Mp_5g19100 [Marchantia polymorpha subsp. ruderalis]|eukprot:PTQ35159.1 hypothetical protein MARPO_0073s0033 [Marchantia polymorpha]